MLIKKVLLLGDVLVIDTSFITIILFNYCYVTAVDAIRLKIINAFLINS